MGVRVCVCVHMHLYVGVGVCVGVDQRMIINSVNTGGRRIIDSCTEKHSSNWNFICDSTPFLF